MTLLLLSHVAFLMFVCHITVGFASTTFRQLPTRFVPWPGTLIKTITVTSPEECVELVEDADIMAIMYNKSGTCNGYDGVMSYKMGSTAAQTTGANTFAWYLRDTSGGCGCTDSVRAQQLINDYTYGNFPCYDGYGLQYDAVSGYCVGKSSAQGTGLFGTKLGFYTAGVTSNDTTYTMTRAQISESVNYDCSEVTPAMPLVYYNIWYCFALVDPKDKGYQLIRDNVCSKFQTNGTPVKIVHPLVYGIMAYHTGTAAVAGIYYDGSSYVYYDNSTLPSDILWDSGCPTGLSMVTVDRNTLALKDIANNTNVINCLTKTDRIS